MSRNSFTDAREKIEIARAARVVAQNLTRRRPGQQNSFVNRREFINQRNWESSRVRNRPGSAAYTLKSRVKDRLAMALFKRHRISDPSFISRYRIDRRQTSVPKQEKFVNLVVEVQSNRNPSPVYIILFIKIYNMGYSIEWFSVFQTLLSTNESAECDDGKSAYCTFSYLVEKI